MAYLQFLKLGPAMAGAVLLIGAPAEARSLAELPGPAVSQPIHSVTLAPARPARHVARKGVIRIHRELAVVGRALVKR
jgi:hypothetical protein